MISEMTAATSYQRTTQTLLIQKYMYERVERNGPQCINVDIGGANPIVSGAPLTSPFDAVIRRQPTPESLEGDIELDTANLVNWAHRVAKEIRG
jgi:hypothetical protein